MNNPSIVVRKLFVRPKRNKPGWIAGLGRSGFKNLASHINGLVQSQQIKVKVGCFRLV